MYKFITTFAKVILKIKVAHFLWTTMYKNELCFFKGKEAYSG